MSQNAPPTPPTPPPSDEPTPEEEKKFLKIIGKWVESDDTPPPTNQPPPTQQAPAQGGNVVSEVLRALEFRDSEKKEKERIAGIENENKALKAAAAVPKKKRPWFSFLAGD